MNKPIYIYVTPFFPSPGTWRGAYCLDFVKALMRMDEYDVKVFMPCAGDDYEIDGIKVYRFPTKQLPSNVFPFLFRRNNERSFLNKVRSVLTTNHQSQTTVSVCHANVANLAIYAVAAKGAFGCRTLLHHHDLMSFGLNLGRLRHVSLYNRILACQLKRLHEQIDCHVFISRLCQRSFATFPNIDWLGDADYSAQARGVKNMPPVRIKRSIILHNGVDTTIFQPPLSPSTKHQAPSTVLIIGCVGNIEPEKGQFDLLCALRIVRDAGHDVRCRMIGSGSDMDRCQAFARNNGIAVEFLPEMRHEQLSAFYHSLDLFVLPTWMDGFGCVFTEAHACGVPFIATTNAGVEDMIRDSDRDRWLCKPRAPGDLATKIINYIQHRPLQHLKDEIAIDKLVANFCKELGGME